MKLTENFGLERKQKVDENDKWVGCGVVWWEGIGGVEML